jgi:hypothetical protein
LAIAMASNGPFAFSNTRLSLPCWANGAGLGTPR